MMSGQTDRLLGNATLNEIHRLWEPGYRERYYQQKFGVELSDREFVNQYVLMSVMPALEADSEQDHSVLYGRSVLGSGILLPRRPCLGLVLSVSLRAFRAGFPGRRTAQDRV